MFKQLITTSQRINLQTFITVSNFLSLVKMSSLSQSCLPDQQQLKLDATYSLSYVTIDSDENATKLARSIVESNLAACVNIIPQLRSIYKWKGKIEEDKENLLLIKSKYSKVGELTEFIKQKHPYQVCEVITVPITHGNPDYLKWIDESVSETIK